MLYVNPSVIGAFTMITTVSAILFMFVWTIILCSYLVYRKQRPHLHEKSIYKMPLGKLMCWACMAFFVFVIVLLTLEDDTRQALLVTPLWFIALGLGCLIICKKRAAELRQKTHYHAGWLNDIQLLDHSPARARGNSTLFSRLM